MSKIYLGRLEDEAAVLLPTPGALVTAGPGGKLASIPVGPDGYALIADSTSPLGLKWGPGGGGSSPTGPAGGDLAGTYPNPLLNALTTGFASTGSLPSGARVVSQVTLASSKSVDWEVVAFKGSTLYRATINGQIGDGTTPAHTENQVVLSPPNGGTFDAPFSVDIYQGNLRLIITPATTGWTVYYRGREFPT